MLVRHIAGVPTATEQRCVRCCEVILRLEKGRPSWPGQVFSPADFSKSEWPIEDCKAVDLTTVELLGVDRVPVEIL